MVTSTVPTVAVPAVETPTPASAVRAGVLSILAWIGVYVGMGILALGALGVVGYFAVRAVMDLV